MRSWRLPRRSQCSDGRDPSPGRRRTVPETRLQTFKPNPYFENEKLIKEYAVTSEDGLTVKSQTKIQWKNGQVCTAATILGACDVPHLLTVRRLACTLRRGVPQDLTAKKATVGGAGTKRKAHDVDETSFFSYFESDNADLNQSMAQILFEDFWRRAFDYHQGVRAIALPRLPPSAPAQLTGHCRAAAAAPVVARAERVGGAGLWRRGAGRRGGAGRGGGGRRWRRRRSGLDGAGRVAAPTRQCAVLLFHHCTGTLQDRRAVQNR